MSMSYGHPVLMKGEQIHLPRVQQGLGRNHCGGEASMPSRRNAKALASFFGTSFDEAFPSSRARAAMCTEGRTPRRCVMLWQHDGLLSL